MRVQGREFQAGDVLVLRGGQEFEIQRPSGVELLSVTVAANAFAEYLDASARGDARMPAAAVIRADAAALAALRRCVRDQVATRRTGTAADFMEAVRHLLASASDVPRQRTSSIAAASMVKESQRIALAQVHEDPPLRIEALCSRLQTSRRTLQNNFRHVTGLSPLVYLRNLRLNAARLRLMASTVAELSVSHAAMDAGFEHFGHFAGSYKLLFGETPSRTVRHEVSGVSPGSQPPSPPVGMRPTRVGRNC